MCVIIFYLFNLAMKNIVFGLSAFDLKILFKDSGTKSHMNECSFFLGGELVFQLF